METEEIKIGDSIFWWGDYDDGVDENGSLKTKYLSGVNKVIEIDLNFLNTISSKYFKLDNKKYMFYELEHNSWELVKTEEKEKCVSCGKETPYTKYTPIDIRFNYVEGGGQLCEHCFNEIYGE